jgi:8-oxo-dGTP diphosphatase
MAAYEVECDLSLRRDGELIMGPEGAAVLRSIADGKPIYGTSAALHLSVKRIRRVIDEMERTSGHQLVSRRKGAKAGLTEEGKELLDIYESHSQVAREQIERRFRNPILTVDGILPFEGGIVLVRRGREPGRGRLALPGGIVEYGETVETAVRREFLEETGLTTRVVRLLGVYSDPERDPRGHFISLLFELRYEEGDIRPGDDAAEAVVMPITDITDLAFDHGNMVNDYLERSDEAHGPKPAHRPDAENP